MPLLRSRIVAILGRLSSGWLSVALVSRLVHDRAPHPVKFRHSGSLFFPLGEGRPVEMHFKRSGVPVHFVQENFSIIVIRKQDLELQSARFIFEACFVRQ